jgi:lipoprotein-anchoring transpeptidase ErfK/SrfK
MNRLPFLTLVFLSPLVGCDRASQAERPPESATTAEPGVVVMRDWDSRLPADQLERDRYDSSWARFVQLDTAGIGSAAGPFPEEWDQISVDALNSGAMHVPIHGSAAGPSVLRAQILLDRVLFSPGIIDGHWGKNSEKAVYWFQRREGLRPTGRMDGETVDRLLRLAGEQGEPVRSHTLTADDVEGPFVTIPEDIYEKAKLDCLCYESLSEKLSEMFHVTPAVLEQLNPDVDLNALGAGDRINVPHLRAPDAGRDAQVDRLVISAEGFSLHALDASGRILFHFPITLGSSYDPSPSGEHRVTSITREPWWHYQPEILAHVDSSEPDAKIPPGPNNAVGMVWMALSIPHYGIHGTSAPETIGYTTSAGCVRLTNWDALFLSERIRPGVRVEFRASAEGPTPRA